MKKDPRKGLMNEVLPAPTTVAGAGPRARTRAHLSKILATVAGLSLHGLAHADATVPSSGAGGSKDKGSVEKPKPPEQPTYAVVDPIPPPVQFGYLEVDGEPGLTVIIDDTPYPEKTPINHARLHVGPHKVVVKSGTKVLRTFEVQIQGNQTTTVAYESPKKALHGPYKKVGIFRSPK